MVLKLIFVVGLTTGGKIGIAFGVIFLILAIILVGLIMFRRRKQNSLRRRLTEHTSIDNPGYGTPATGETEFNTFPEYPLQNVEELKFGDSTQVTFSKPTTSSNA